MALTKAELKKFKASLTSLNYEIRDGKLIEISSGREIPEQAAHTQLRMIAKLKDIDPDEAIDSFRRTRATTTKISEDVMLTEKRIADLNFSITYDDSLNEQDKKFLEYLAFSVEASNPILYLKHENNYRVVGTCDTDPRQLERNLQSQAGQIPHNNDETLAVYLERVWQDLLRTSCDYLKKLYNLQKNDRGDLSKQFLDRVFPRIACSEMLKVTLYGYTHEDEINNQVKTEITDVRMKSNRGTRNTLHIWEYLSALSLRMPSLAPDREVSPPKVYTSVPGVPSLNFLDLNRKVPEVSKKIPPTWKKLLARYTDDEKRVLMAFIWSILDSENRGRQCLYMYDKGYTGKTAMINAIKNAIGSKLVQSLQKDSLSNQFGMAKIYNKRLVTLDDNKNPNILRSEKMHMLLGGGSADVELKGKDSFSYQLDTKVIIGSNIKPEIDTDFAHERTRVILLEPRLTEELKREIFFVDPETNELMKDSQGNLIAIGGNDFSEKLCEEFWEFAAVCKLVYRKMCPTNAEIIIPGSIRDRMYDSLISTPSELYEEFVNSCLAVCGRDEGVTTGDLLSSFRRYMNKIKEKSDNAAYAKCRDWLIKRYDLEVRRIEEDGKRTRKFMGLRLNEEEDFTGEI